MLYGHYTALRNHRPPFNLTTHLLQFQSLNYAQLSTSRNRLRALTTFDNVTSRDAIKNGYMPARRPTRHGENLSARYARLERSLRGKTGYLTEMNDLASTSFVLHSEMGSATAGESAGSKLKDTLNPSPKAKKGTQRSLMGVVIPEKPVPPADDGMSLILSSVYRD